MVIDGLLVIVNEFVGVYYFLNQLFIAKLLSLIIIDLVALDSQLLLACLVIIVYSWWSLKLVIDSQEWLLF